MIQPDHKDFWKLSRLLIAHDNDSLGVEDYASIQLSKEIDSYSVTYVAVQRALRAMGITDASILREQGDQVALYAAMWLDGFLIGRDYEKGERSEDPLHQTE